MKFDLLKRNMKFQCRSWQIVAQKKKWSLQYLWWMWLPSYIHCHSVPKLDSHWRNKKLFDLHPNSLVLSYVAIGKAHSDAMNCIWILVICHDVSKFAQVVRISWYELTPYLTFVVRNLKNLFTSRFGKALALYIWPHRRMSSHHLSSSFTGQTW